ncbi:MAG: ATPase [Muribaculaceae bacterium]|nr:ATPase [Muribaculaceae bacterium]
MTIIADCGSTKIEWCVLNGAETVSHIVTPGLNAMMVTEEEMAQFFASEVSPNFKGMAIDNIYFYGAGCINETVNGRVARALASCIDGPTIIEVQSDLLAAARALCGTEPGIACIMGTGSNSCLYDGEEIVEHVSPLGYVLGDEGSGASLGRLLLGDVLKGQLPAELCKSFLSQFQLDLQEILNRVYLDPQPNRFLASVSRFLIDYIEEPAIHRLVLNEFKAFFVRNIYHYTGYKQLPVNFVGSIAYYYKDVLGEAAAAVDCHIGTILKSPMEGLITYHSHQK